MLCIAAELNAGSLPNEILYNYFNRMCSLRQASVSDRIKYLEAREEIASAPWDFIIDLARNTGKSLYDLIALFKNTVIVKFFSKIGWSFKKFYDILRKGYHYYIEFQKAIAEYVAESKIGRWTAEELKNLDEWLQNHPKLRQFAGPAIGAMLVFIWFAMSFTGDFDWDFDMNDILAALSGQFSLAGIFAGTEGMRMLLAFVTGAAFKISFPYPGPQTIQFVIAIILTLAGIVGKKVKDSRDVEKEIEESGLVST